MTRLTLDRMALDDVGTNPVRLATAIHRQLAEGTGPVPVGDIARALDIVEVREEALINFEGALVTTPERGFGSILVNRRSSRRRRRFTLSHELLHFLNPLHRPTSPDGFWCSREDMRANRLDSGVRHLRQEAEANTFAIELLAPPARIKRYLRGEPDLAKVLSMSDGLDISKEAAARRYVVRHGDTMAAVFSHNRRFLYAERSTGFPWLNPRGEMVLPDTPAGAAETGLSRVKVRAHDGPGAPSTGRMRRHASADRLATGRRLRGHRGLFRTPDALWRLSRFDGVPRQAVASLIGQPPIPVF